MDKRYRHILRYALAAVPLACVALLSSCSFDDDYDGSRDGGAPVAVRINVSAGEPGDLNGTRAGDDVNADEHEFMHTLRLYIVDESDGGTTARTVLDLSPDLTNNTLAQTGDLTNWVSGEFTLDPGTYTLYAFANVEGYSGEYGFEEGTRVVTKKTAEEVLNRCFSVSSEITEDDLNQFRLTNPAGAIDLANGKYIPMSAKRTITISGDLNNSATTDISIGLDRLVSKVQLQLGEEGQAQLPAACSLIFSGYSQNVPLMARAANTSTDDEFASYYGTRTATTTIDNVMGGQLVEFYVNETPDGDPFTVNLNTMGDAGLTTYTSTTVTTTELPRNSIFPLTLNFPDYVPDFNWQAWLAPIGDWAEVETEFDGETYIVKVPEGAKFNFTLNGMWPSSDVDVTAEWNVPGSTAKWFTNLTYDNSAISGYITASGAGTRLPLSVTASWKAGLGSPYTLNRKYNVIIELIDITDADFKTRAGGEQSRLLTPEVLNMFIKR